MTKPVSQPHHEGWVKLYRSLLNKPIWTETTAEQKVLLISLLMKAAYTKRTWIYQGMVYNLEPGQLITSINSLIELGGTGVTHRKVRTALTLFEKAGFLTQKTSKKNTLITIANWETYQSDAALPTQEASQPRHSGDTEASHQPTTNKKLRSKEGVEGEEQHREKPKAKEEQDRVAEATPLWWCSETIENQVLHLYHITCTNLPKVRVFTEKRRNAISTCCRGLKWHEAVSTEEALITLFAEGLEKAAATPFLNGENEKGWKTDFDWLMKPENMTKVLESKYDRLAPVQSSDQPSKRITGFHLPESRGKGYNNDQLEAILLGKKSNKERRVNV